MSPSFGARQDLCRTTKEDGAGELSAPAAGMKMLGSERRRKRRIFLLDGDAMPLVRAEDDMPLVRDFIHSAHDFAAILDVESDGVLGAMKRKLVHLHQASLLLRSFHGGPQLRAEPPAPPCALLADNQGFF